MNDCIPFDLQSWTKRVLFGCVALLAALPAWHNALGQSAELAMEKRVLFGPESAAQWAVAECSLETSAPPVGAGHPVLRWHLTVDHFAGDAKYPIGWPRISHPLRNATLRDWSGWDYLQLRIYSYSNGDPFNYLDGSAMDFFNRHEADGTPMPVSMWEACREGYDDYRYVFTLEQLIAEAKQSRKPAVQTLAATAEQELQSVWNAIRVQPKYKYDGLWSPVELDVYRWLVAQQVSALIESFNR